jgi:dihydrodipicolinate synthase/N-acetylneuraminate lyase
MSNVEMSGVFAALLSPRKAEGSFDVPALRRRPCRFSDAIGISFVVNGATGEFCLTSPVQLRTVLSTVRCVSEGRARILCCVGAVGGAQCHRHSGRNRGGG